MPVRRNELKRKITAGEIPIGPNLQIPSPQLVEMAALAGFDYVMLDGEHGQAYENLFGLVIAAQGAGITPVVRVPGHERAPIVNALEAGAQAIQVPMVETPEQAEWLVREVKYAPVGNRGFSTATRAASYGLVDKKDLGKAANDEMLLILQLESRRALENVEAIAAVPGVDMLFIGPADLAQAVGLSGEDFGPRMNRVMEELFQRIPRRMPVGTSAFGAQHVRHWTAVGFRCIVTWSTKPILDTFTAVHAEMRSGLTS